MTEELVYERTDFDKPEELFTEFPSTFTYFGDLYYIDLRMDFEKGASFTIPGLFKWRQNEAKTAWEKQGLLEFVGGCRLNRNGRHKVFILAMDTEDKNGQFYQRILWPFKSVDKEVWKAIQQPILAKLPDLKALAGSWIDKKPLFAKVVEKPSGHTFTDKEGKVREIRIWDEIVIYPDKATMAQARQEFFASLGQTNGDVTKNYDHYPHNWRGTPDQLIRNVRKQYAAGRSITEIAKALLLIGKDGKPATIDKPPKGEEGKIPADIPLILAEILAPEMDLPASLLADPFKTELGL